MNLMLLTRKLGTQVIHVVNRHDTTIMTGLVIAGVIGTGYLSGKATIKAYKVLEEAEYTSKEPLTKKEKLKKVWKIYIPPFAVAAATVTIAIGAQKLNLDRQTNLFQAVCLAENARKEFEAKTENVIGKNKTEKIREEILSDKINVNPPTDENIFLTSHGDTLCFDVFSGRYFKHDIEKIKAAINTCNNRINNFERITMNELYRELDIPTLERIGDDYEYSNEYTGLMEPKFTSILTANDIPCFVLDFYNPPALSYRRA